jgi:hypothetical protein
MAVLAGIFLVSLCKNNLEKTIFKIVIKKISSLAVLSVSVALTACGGGGSAAGAAATTDALAVFAGNMDGIGNVDGTGTAARFNYTASVASDSAGNIYVADVNNNTIRKVTPSGVVSTLAGLAGSSGSADGTGSSARFNNPTGVATDSAGNVYVADLYNYTIRKITSSGVVSTLAGLAGSSGSANGTGSLARFNNATGVATDSAGNVYVTDRYNYIIRKITPSGVVSTFAGLAGSSGSSDGTGAAARFGFTYGIATDSVGNVYVTDTNTIRVITPTAVVTTLAGLAGNSGSLDGTGAAARFNFPTGVTTDSTGNVYVTDTNNNTIRKITPAGVVTTFSGLAGSRGSADGTVAAARYYLPRGIATDSGGNFYVADSYNQTIRKITASGVVSTFVGSLASAGTLDGSGTAARFHAPLGVATDNAKNVYVADTENHTIRKISADGVVSTFAGLAGTTGSLNGAGTAARFNLPYGVATDSAGNVYVADTNNNTIRKITPAGTVSTLAGTAGTFGSLDGTGAAARFDIPYSVATDSAGNVYVAERGSSTIRKITPAGVVTTLAGLSGPPGGNIDGTGSQARFSSPNAVATDSAGNVYVADTDNHTLRKITPAGVVSTLAGMGGIPGSANGTGIAARFNYPTGVATDSAGNVYVADKSSHTIRKVTPAGVVSTLVGVAGKADFAAGALPGALVFPHALAISGNTLYITTNNGVAVVKNLP